LLLLAKGVWNMTKTIKKENVIASNLLSLASSEWIVTNRQVLVDPTYEILLGYGH
jgi:hypothetical protein